MGNGLALRRVEALDQLINTRARTTIKGAEAGAVAAVVV
jgi:hypothetical protein